MKYASDRPHRRSIRLKGYDYTRPGAYFVTICTANRECLFGDVVDDDVQLNEFGKIVWATSQDIPNHLPHVRLDVFVVMPNHVHGIVWIMDDNIVRAGANVDGIKSAPTTIPNRHGLPEIVRQFKMFSARRINQHSNTPGLRIWQRNYYEHIIRDEPSLNRIREYILTNPLRWASDHENPAAQKHTQQLARQINHD